MRLAARLQRLVRNLCGRQRLESTLDEELRAYIDDMTERKIREGLTPAEARRQALIEAGGIEQVKEEVRGVWLGVAIETTLRDLHYAGRALRRSPGFTAVVIATLALGIGANVTMFSLMRAVLWRPLPYPDPERMVTIQVELRNVANAGAAHGELRDLRTRSRLLDQISMISVVDANLDYNGEMEHLPAASVSDDFLPLFGARPVLGRTLNSRIDDADHARNVVISDALWRRRFGADPTVVGRGVRINNLEMQIAGVLPPDFRLFLPPSVQAAEQIDIWFSASIGGDRQSHWFPVIARLKRGATLAQANAELQALSAQFVREHPEIYRDGRLRQTAFLLHDDMTRDARPALFLLTVAVGFVLLIACVNVANLMLARGATRQRELAIRRALGAGQGRLIRQLLTESLVLGIAGGGGGLLLARFGLDALSKLSNSHLPMQSRIAMDAPVALFALTLSVGASLLFGLLPAWRIASGRVSDPLRAGRTETAAAGMRTLQRALVVAEVSLSIVPLVCGGLMLRTFLNLVHVPLGFDPAHRITAKLPISLRMFPEGDRRLALYRDVLDRVRALPGVEAVSAASPLPLAPFQITRRVGRDDRSGVPGILATQETAMDGYLRVAGTPLLQGREFTGADLAEKRRVVIVDERLARRLWPEGAMGRRLTIERGATKEVLEVIGVTASIRATRVRDESMPHFVIPYPLYPIEMSLMVKTRQSAQSLAPAIQRVVDAAHTGRAAFDIRSMSGYVDDSIGDTRFIMLVLAVFAISSVLLAAVGLYGTLAYLVAQRTREFGIRLALGSTVRGIVTMVVREGALLAALGAGVGLAGSWAMTQAIRQLLYNVNPFDGVTLLGVIVLVALIAVASAGVPAWRATLIDPQISLRSE